MALVEYSQAMTAALHNDLPKYTSIVDQIKQINNDQVLLYKYEKYDVNPLRRAALLADQLGGEDSNLSLLIRGDGKDGYLPGFMEQAALDFDKTWGTSTSLKYGQTLQEIPNNEKNTFLFQLTELVLDGKIEDAIPYFEVAINNGLDLNQKDKFGSTVLHKFSNYFHNNNNNLKLIDFLIKNKVDVNSKDSYGKTPLHYAIKNSNSILAAHLKKNGAKVTIQDENGESPLTMAGNNGDINTIQMLLGYHIPDDLTTLPKSVQNTILKDRARIARAQEWETYIQNNPNSLWGYVPSILRYGKKTKRSKRHRNYKKKSFTRK